VPTEPSQCDTVGSADCKETTQHLWGGKQVSINQHAANLTLYLQAMYNIIHVPCLTFLLILKGHYTISCKVKSLCNMPWRHIALLTHNLSSRRVWVVNATLRPLYIRERAPVPLVQGTGWASESVLTDAKNLARTGVRTLDRPACNESRSTDYAELAACTFRHIILIRHKHKMQLYVPSALTLKALCSALFVRFVWFSK
jgi:hypothetical protein